MHISFNWMQTVFFICQVVGVSFASNFPLEILNIKPVKTGKPAIASGNRIFRAYPGIDYNIRAAVIGGEFPYKYYLTKKPVGMSIDTLTGEISWKDPKANADATIKVKDSNNKEVSASWTINVTTDGFLFIDSSVGTSGKGTISNPFKRMMDIMGADKYDKKYSEYIVYFRKGTYDLEGYLDNKNDPTRVIFNNKPAVWIAYPGECVAIDFKRQNFAQWTDYNIYHEGFEIKNCGNHGFQTGSHYSTFRKLYFHDLIDIIGGHNNQSFLCLSSGGYANVIQNCNFNTLGAGSDIKLYGHTKCLIENNVVHNNSANEGFAVKMSNDTVIIRNNIFSAMPRGAAITIDAYIGDGRGCRNTEILYNQIYDCSRAMVLGSNGALGLTCVYKNLIKGVPSVRYVKETEGPVSIYDNIIANSFTDKGQVDEPSYYRDGIWYDNSPKAYNPQIVLNNSSGTTNVNNSSDNFFFPLKVKPTMQNSVTQVYDMFGRRIVWSGNHDNVSIITVWKQNGIFNTKCILKK